MKNLKEFQKKIGYQFKNELNVTVTETYQNSKTNQISETFTIKNNAESTYTVGDYQVFVSTKGNTQIRACYIVE